MSQVEWKRPGAQPAARKVEKREISREPIAGLPGVSGSIDQRFALGT